MRFQVAQLAFALTLIAHSLIYCSAASKDNLRGGKAQQGDADIEALHEGDEFRFLNTVFEKEGGASTERCIVKYGSHDAMIRSQKKRSSKHSIMTIDKYDMQVMHLSKAEREEMMKDADVSTIEPDPLRYLYSGDADSLPHRKVQNSEEVPYGIDMVKALSVPDDFVAGRKVCIIDTGYDINHPDLPNSPDSVSGDDNRGNRWDRDGNGHGTHVAGTIAAIGNNGQGVVGVNRNGELGLHIIRIFGDNGRPIFGSTLMGAAQDCVDAGSNIISMSLGGPIPNSIERDFFQSIYEQQNVLVIAAAGNSGNTQFSYPASYDAVMSVAAIDEDKNLAVFSQRNNQVEISAPGVGVLSTKTGGGYIAYSGTSMACPHAAGVAALVWSHATDLTSIQMRGVLRETAEDLGAAGRDNSYGYGLVRADRAYQMVNGEFTLSPTAAPTPERPCYDFADFEDSRGNGCDWYGGGIFNRCSFFGNSRPNDDGFTGNDACCVCGGGQYEAESPTSTPTGPTASPTGTPTQCVDVEGWENSLGRDCDWHGPWRCIIWGNSFENDGLVANEACCNCQ